MSICDKLNYLIETKNQIKTAIQNKGVQISDTDTFRSYADKIGEIEGENTSSPSDDWQPEPDWFDIETILENDTEEYTQKAIFLLADFLDDKSTTNSIKGFTKYKLSDGQVINKSATTTLDINDIFDTTKDKSCKKGYKTRYIIAYSNSNEVLSITLPSNIIYCIFDGAILKPINLLSSKRFLQAVKFKDNVSFEGTSFNSMFLGDCSLQKVQGLKTLNGITFSNSFGSCYNLRKMILDLSNAIDINAIFSSCSNLHEVTLLHALKIENFNSAFNGCSSLKKLTGLNIPNNANSTIMFTNCNSLIEILDITAINTDISFSACTFLSHSTLIRILNALVDLTDKENKTLTLGSNNLEKLTDEEKAIATNKNWILK